MRACLLLTGGFSQPPPCLHAVVTSISYRKLLLCSICWLTACVRANKQTGRGNIRWSPFSSQAFETLLVSGSQPQVVVAASTQVRVARTEAETCGGGPDGSPSDPCRDHHPQTWRWDRRSQLTTGIRSAHSVGVHALQGPSNRNEHNLGLQVSLSEGKTPRR